MSERLFWADPPNHGIGLIPMPILKFPNLWELQSLISCKAVHSSSRARSLTDSTNLDLPGSISGNLRWKVIYSRLIGLWGQKFSFLILSAKKQKNDISKLNPSLALFVRFHQMVNLIRFKELSYQVIQTLSIEFSKNRILVGHCNFLTQFGILRMKQLSQKSL
jgi:hypothetical protein